MNSKQFLIPSLLILVAFASFFLIIKEPKNYQEPIKIGVSLPLTGQVASFGQNALAGVLLAAKEINERGGIRGKQLQLIIEDDRCSNTEGINVFKKFIEAEQVTAIAGPVCSPVGAAALPLAQERNIPTVLVIASAPPLTKVGDYIFRVYPSDEHQGAAVAQFIIKQFPRKRVGMIFTDNDFGQGVKSAFEKRFKELNGEIVFQERVLPDQKDFRVILEKFQKANAEILYFPVFPVNAIAALKQLKEMDIGIPIIGATTFQGDEVVKSGVADGVIFPAVKTNKSEEFVKKLHELPGMENLQINVAAAHGYDAIKVLASAIERGGFESEVIKKALQEIRFEGGMSHSVIEFDAEGNLKEFEYEFRIISKGSEQPYQSSH